MATFSKKSLVTQANVGSWDWMTAAMTDDVFNHATRRANVQNGQITRVIANASGRVAQALEVAYDGTG